MELKETTKRKTAEQSRVRDCSRMGGHWARINGGKDLWKRLCHGREGHLGHSNVADAKQSDRFTPSCTPE